MIRWICKHRTLMHRLPVLMALLAGIMFTSMPAGKQLPHGWDFTAAGLHQQQQKNSTGPEQQASKSASGEELPVYKPGFTALAQVAPLQIFLYQAVMLPVVLPLVEITEPLSVAVPGLVNRFHRILFRRIISPNAP